VIQGIKHLKVDAIEPQGANKYKNYSEQSGKLCIFLRLKKNLQITNEIPIHDQLPTSRQACQTSLFSLTRRK
jgi:hypothetical protein